MPTFDPDKYFNEQFDAVADASTPPSIKPDFTYRPDPLIDKMRELASARERKQAGLELLQKQGGTFVPAFGVGTGRAFEGLGVLYGLLPGQDVDNPLTRLGRDATEYWEDRKSGYYIGEQMDLANTLEETDGLWDEFSTAFTETVTNPTLLLGLLAEQAPSLAISGATGGTAGIAAQSVNLSQMAARRIALGSALAANAAQQGGDVAGETYERILALPEEILEESPVYRDLQRQVGSEEARIRLARSGARTAGAQAAAVTGVTSLGINVLPGGQTIERALTRNTVAASLPGRVVRGAVGEGTQEIIEEGSGQLFSNLAVRGLDPSQDMLEGVGEGTALGLLGGGILGGLTAAPGRNEAKAAKRKEQSDKIKEQNAAALRAVDSGDVSALIDPESPTYSPPRAAMALFTRARDNSLTPEERAVARQEFEEVRRAVETQVEQQKEIIASYDDAYVSNLGKERGRARSIISLAEEGLATPEEVAEAEATLQRVNSTVERLRTRPANKKQAEQQLKELEEQARVVNDISGRLTKLDNQDGQLQEKIETLRTATDPIVRAEEAIAVIQLHMEDPNSLTSEQLEQLAEDENSGFNEVQRGYLRAAREAQPLREQAASISRTRAGIFVGEGNFKGITDYQKDVSYGIRSNNRSLITQSLADLRKFSASHGEKARLAQEGVRQATETNTPRYLVRDTTDGSSWTLTDKLPKAWSRERRSRSGGLTLHSNSAKLASDIAIEAAALESTLVQLEAAVAAHDSVAATAPVAGTAPQNVTEPSVPVDSPTVEGADITSEAPIGEVVEETAPIEPATQSDELANLLALSDDEAIARLNPGNVRASEEDVITLSSGDLDIPMDAEVAGSFTDNNGETIGLYSSGNGGLYAVQANAVLGRIEPGTEDNETVIDVVQDAQGRGIGVELVAEYIRRNPTAQVGSFTDAGEATYRAALRKLRQSQETNGGLSVLQDGSARINGNLNEEQANTVNRIAAYFTQESAKPDARTKRPLVVVKDFLSNWLLNNDLALSYIDKPDEVSSGQRELLDSLMSYAESWSRRIRDNIENSQVNEKFYREDYTQYFKEHGIDENLTTAISVGAYTWIVENVGNFGINTEDDIRRILHLDDDESIPREAREVLSTAGTRDKLVIQSIGKHIAEALGLRTHNGAPANEQQLLEGALGSHGLAILLQTGWVERHMVAGAIINTESSVTSLKDGTLVFEAPIGSSNNIVTINATPVPRQGQIVTEEDMKDLRVLGKLTFKYTLTAQDGSHIPTPKGKKNLAYLRRHAERAFKELHTPHPFVRIKRDWESEENTPLSAEVQRIGELSRGFGSVIHKLFGSEANYVTPEFSPLEYAQTKVRGTSAKVPSILQKARQLLMKRPHVLRQDMLTLKRAFDRDMLLVMEGYRPVGDTYIRASRLKSVEARNADIIRSYDNLDAFEQQAVRDNKPRPFFFDYSMYRQQRLGMNSNLINPQSDKVHRRYVAMESWDTAFTVGSNNVDEVFFKLSVAQGLGIDTDKQLNATSLAQLDEFLAREDVQEAIEYLQSVGSLNDGETLPIRGQYIISSVVESTGNATHALDALYSIANYLNTPDGESFQTQLMYEVDGVSNGAALSNLALGILDGALGEKFGFFSEDSEAVNYTEWRSRPDSTDYYETLGGELLKALEDVATSPREQAFLRNINIILGPGATGRNAVKTPTLALVFGSSMKGVVDGMVEDFFEGMDTQLEKAANEGNEEQVKAIMDAINDILKSYNVPLLPEYTTIEAAMEWTLSPQQARVLGDAFNKTYGTAMTWVVDDFFDDFITTRANINQAGNNAWALYHIAYDHLLNLRTKELAEQGLIPTDSQGRPLQEPSAEVIAEIREQLKPLEPIVRTPMAKRNNETAAGLWLGKNTNRLATPDDVPYIQRVAIGDPLPGRKANSRLEARGNVTTAEAPGVSPMIMLIHSLESAITEGTYEAFDTLHIFDAEGFKLSDTTEGAKSLNKNTYRMSADYSVGIEVFNTYSQVMQAFEELSKTYPELQEAKAKYQKEAKTNFATALKNLEISALRSEVGKQLFLSRLKSVDQFALEDGQYDVTDHERAVTRRRAEKLQARLDALMGRTTADTTAPEESRTEAAPASVEERVPEAPAGRKYPADTPWGRVGDPIQASDESLVNFFESTPNPTPRQLLTEVAKVIKADTTIREGTKNLQLELARQLYRVIGDNLEVTYIKPDTPMTAKHNVKTARGWYRMDKSGERIAIKSPDFIYSSVTPETILHELTHAATAQIIEQELRKRDKNPEYSSPALQAIDELESLRSLAERAITDGKLTSMTPAVKDVHELVAWGMTNREFQKLLYGLKVESNAPSNPLFNGMRAFISNLVSIIFPNRKADAKENFESGFGALIANVSILMAAQTEQTEGSYAVTLRQEADPTTYTSEEVFEALGRTDTAQELPLVQSKRLTELLTDVVDAVYGSDSSIKSRYEREAPAETLDAFINSITTGNIPFTSPAINNIRLTDQEAFVLEQIELASKTALNSDASQPIRAELGRIYRIARKELKNADLPEGVYDYLFNAELGENRRSDFLSRFMAASLVYQPLYEALDNVDTTQRFESMAGQSLGRRLVNLYHRLVSLIRGWQTGSRDGMRTGNRLEVLARSMAQIEMKRKLRLAREQRDSPFGYIETRFKKASDKLREAVTKTADSSLVRDSRFKSVRGIGGLVRTVAQDRTDSLVDLMIRTRDRVIKGKHDTLTSVISEIRGGATNSEQFHSLLWEMSEHQRQRRREKELTISLTRSAFGRELSKEESEALTRAFVRTGMSDIMGDFDIATMDTLLSSDEALETAIAEWENKLPESKFRNYYLNSSETLGIYLATGEVVEALSLNAHNIVFLGGFDENTRNSVDVAEANQNKKIVDTLISLYALKHMDTNTKITASNIVREELRRDSGNGIEFLLKSHAHMQKMALSDLFNGEEVHMAKGYTKEIFNPYVSIEVADAAKGEQLVKAGYRKGARVRKDPADPDAGVVHHIYSIRDGGLNPWVSGIMGTVSQKAMGTTVYDVVSQRSNEIYGDVRKAFGERANTLLAKEVERRTNVLAEAHQKRLKDMMSKRKDYSTNRKPTTVVAPVLNSYGDVAEFRYLMNEHTKEVVLQRDNRLEYVFGEMASHAYDKAGAPEINKAAINALWQDYVENYAKRPESFIRMSPHNADKDISERYLTLTEETRKHIKEVWGDDEIWVRKELMDQVFGYRKVGITQKMFESDPVQRGLAASMFVTMAELFMGKKAALYLRRAGDFWQALVRIIKDNRVIRSLFVLVINNMSNMTQLYLMGVPIRKILSGMYAGHRDAITYSRDQRELWKLQQLTDVGYIPPGQTLNEIQQRIVELTDSINRNPMHRIADAGLQQTIVQDIEPDEDQYSYRAQWSRKLKEYSGWVPNIVKSTGKTVFMAHGTPIYEVMRTGAQLGDFVSRHILFEHLTSKQDSPMDTDAALSMAMDAFVNYDLPTHKNIQYLNDMGILWFTKYYFRIQKVLFQALRTNPARAIGLLAASNIMPGMSTILDALFWARGRWVGMGALEYLDSFDSISTLRAMKAVMNPFG